jgi:hypothetical protein
MKSSIFVLLLTLFISLSTVTSGIVFASSGNWIEVTRFTGGTHEHAHKTEFFTCDHVEWRIRWEYEPRTDIPGDQTGIEFRVYTQENPDNWFKFSGHWGESGETNGTNYIHDKNGTFNLEIISSAQNYTLIVEQDLDSIPEFSSWIILPLTMAATLIAAVIRRRHL